MYAGHGNEVYYVNTVNRVLFMLHSDPAKIVL